LALKIVFWKRNNDKSFILIVIKLLLNVHKLKNTFKNLFMINLDFAFVLVLISYKNVSDKFLIFLNKYFRKFFRNQLHIYFVVLDFLSLLMIF